MEARLYSITSSRAKVGGEKMGHERQERGDSPSCKCPTTRPKEPPHSKRRWGHTCSAHFHCRGGPKNSSRTGRRRGRFPGERGVLQPIASFQGGTGRAPQMKPRTKTRRKAHKKEKKRSQSEMTLKGGGEAHSKPGTEHQTAVTGDRAEGRTIRVRPLATNRRTTPST